MGEVHHPSEGTVGFSGTSPNNSGGIPLIESRDPADCFVRMHRQTAFVSVKKIIQ